MQEEPTAQYQYYGTASKASEVNAFIDHVLSNQGQVETTGQQKTPICIWGKHGIGKTELVATWAKEKGYAFAYIAPAQFEEMGDLIGMPSIEEGKTVFRAPAWVPTAKGPGILLIDDVNRADDRILRGIMQLLQNYELVSWQLPDQWHIILTANPDGGDYSVTPMDDAMLTRMLHITLTFDILEWAKWAEKNEIDPRGIQFVLTHPTSLSGERTTPRTLVQFFAHLTSIPDLSQQLPLVKSLADSCLDENTVKAFVTFVTQGLDRLPQPSDLLSSQDFKQEIQQPIAALVQQGTLRVDILASLCTRLVNYLSLHHIQPNPQELANIQAFIKLPFLPSDLRFALAQDLVGSQNPHLGALIGDPVIGKLVLEGMGGGE